jgi:membrane-associated protease RseP (regulator of RpoE activity)
MSTHARRATRPWTAVIVGIGFLAALSALPVVAQPEPGNVPPPRPAADVPSNPKDAPAANPKSDSGYLGIIGDDRQENGTGVRIIEIETGGPGENGGLKEDDLITSVNGKAVHSTPDMGKIVEALPAGSQVTFEVDRGGKKQTVQVTLGKRPPPDQRRYAQFGRVNEPDTESQSGAERQPGGGLVGRGQGALAPGNVPPSNAGPGNNVASGPLGLVPGDTPAAGELPPPPSQSPSNSVLQRRQLLGVRTQPVTDEIRRRLALPVANGAWVVSRTLGSAAEKAGIPLDAVITAVDKAPISSPQDLARQVSQAGSGHTIELTYFSEGKFHRTNVVLADIAGQAPLTGQGPSLRPADAPAELPPGGFGLPSNPVNPGSQPFPPKSTQAQIEALNHRLDELDERVRQLEQAQRK